MNGLLSALIDAAAGRVQVVRPPPSPRFASADPVPMEASSPPVPPKRAGVPDRAQSTAIPMPQTRPTERRHVLEHAATAPVTPAQAPLLPQALSRAIVHDYPGEKPQAIPLLQHGPDELAEVAQRLPIDAPSSRRSPRVDMELSRPATEALLPPLRSQPAAVVRVPGIPDSQRPSPGPAAREAPMPEIRIGRIEVNPPVPAMVGKPAAPPASTPRAAPRQSLDDYLARRRS